MTEESDPSEVLFAAHGAPGREVLAGDRPLLGVANALTKNHYLAFTSERHHRTCQIYRSRQIGFLLYEVRRTLNANASKSYSKALVPLDLHRRHLSDLAVSQPRSV